MQFWSEPLERVLWEVSSGKWNPPADEWLAGERSQRIEALGFVIGGKAENFHRTIPLDSAGDIAAVAKAVVKIFYEGFDYRGTLPIRAQLVYGGRSVMEATYESFTPTRLQGEPTAREPCRPPAWPRRSGPRRSD